MPVEEDEKGSNVSTNANVTLISEQNTCLAARSLHGRQGGLVSDASYEASEKRSRQKLPQSRKLEVTDQHEGESQHRRSNQDAENERR